MGGGGKKPGWHMVLTLNSDSGRADRKQLIELRDSKGVTFKQIWLPIFVLRVEGRRRVKEEA